MPSPSLRARWALVILLCALAFGSGLSAAAQDAAIDPELQQELDRVAREIATLRELPPLAEVDDVLLTQAELQAMMPALLGEEIDPDEVMAQSRALAALGIIPEGTDLLDLTTRLLGEQARGFYDPLTDEMIVVAEDQNSLGIEEYFYAHEIVHALQDAHLDPDDFLEDRWELNGDEALAVLALYEGDAVSATNDYLLAHPELAVALLQELQVDFPELDQAPAAVSAALVFPYSSGLAFVDRLRGEGGWDAVDAAYADLPASTEQILHPRKYLFRDEPSNVALPEPETALGDGWRLVDEDTLGELQIGLLLADLEPGEGFNPTTGRLDLPEAARNAATGWDGDRFALWEDGEGGEGREVLVWRSVWDTPEDARAFGRALARFGEGRWEGIFNGESPDDVALVTAEIAARIAIDGQEVFYVHSPELSLTDKALGSLQNAPTPDPAPGPD